MATVTGLPSSSSSLPLLPPVLPGAESTVPPYLQPAQDSLVSFDPTQESFFSCCACEDTSACDFSATWPASLAPPERTTWEKIGRICWDIFSIICLPIGLVRLFIYFIYILASYAFLPASALTLFSNFLRCFSFCSQTLRDHFQEQDESWNRFLTDSQFTLLRLKTPDNIHLEGVVKMGSDFPNKAIIYVGGNGVNMRHSGYELNQFAAFGITVMMVNPHGVGKSEGRPHPRALGLDIYTAAEYLINVRGIDPSDIVFYGWSMGGAAANAGASLIQAKYPGKLVNILCDRTFAKLSSLVQTLTGGGCFGRFCAWLTHAVGWDIDNVTTFSRLRGKKCILYAPNDRLITPAESLFAYLPEPRENPILLSGDHGGLTYSERVSIMVEIFQMLGLNPEKVTDTFEELAQTSPLLALQRYQEPQSNNALLHPPALPAS